MYYRLIIIPSLLLNIKYVIIMKGALIMPEISRFYGIVIKMFFKPKEHEPSHIHALYNEYMGIYNLQTLQMIEGNLPTKAQELVLEWLVYHQSELLHMWETQNIHKLPPL